MAGAIGLTRRGGASGPRNLTEPRWIRVLLTILALGSVGTTSWWVQRVGADLDLYVWEKEQMEPVRTRFPGSGIEGKAKAEKVIWLGGKRLLVQPSFSNSLKLLGVDEAGKVTWPNRDEVVGTTTVVIVYTCIVGVFLFLVDAAVTPLVNKLFAAFGG